MTTQVAHNKSIFGVIDGGKLRLNALGEEVRDAWLSLFTHNPELRQDAFVVMPNHSPLVLHADIQEPSGARRFRLVRTHPSRRDA